MMLHCSRFVDVTTPVVNQPIVLEGVGSILSTCDAPLPPPFGGLWEVYTTANTSLGLEPA